MCFKGKLILNCTIIALVVFGCFAAEASLKAKTNEVRVTMDIVANGFVVDVLTKRRGGDYFGVEETYIARTLTEALGVIKNQVVGCAGCHQ